MLTEVESKLVNNFCAEVADDESYPTIFGGKSIPYIGWFWRDVDFTNPFCMGVIPKGRDHNERPLVGFMENNKWDYPYADISNEQCEEIASKLLKAAMEDNFGKRYEILKEVGGNIQELKEGR